MVELIRDYLPLWALPWLQAIGVGLQILLIVAGAWGLRRMLRRLVQRLGSRHQMPLEFLVPLSTFSGWLIIVGASLMVMERVGVSMTVLWTAITGFAAMAAVAFFAAWSVLSNLFCAFLIFSSSPFRVGDVVELLESGDKPGLKGRVIAVHLLYTTLMDMGGEDSAGAYLQIPNSMFFQKSLRRWRDSPGLGALPASTLDNLEH
ncbi:mechanosensitive ion channel-like protein [Comamonas sp. BIGb0124]|uniref:mechanosensitive ion channel family protein n=1 Tax=Comamonas sp. BIGb0124 TaxID=2485130 RepID=UPI000F9B4425|nr:mechanosensitive ion channel family protein [Comamonas sp. BIGb0124]ROR18145.1 mechanosensitive ion channel-like protein [Comamonas sp. BIGb0124]